MSDFAFTAEERAEAYRYCLEQMEVNRMTTFWHYLWKWSWMIFKREDIIIDEKYLPYFFPETRPWKNDKAGDLPWSKRMGIMQWCEKEADNQSFI